MTSSTTTTAPEQVEVAAPAEDWKGQNVPRKEDRRLVQGQGVFVDDVKRHGMGYIHFVRSPYAHAHITSIDVSASIAQIQSALDSDVADPFDPPADQNFTTKTFDDLNPAWSGVPIPWSAPGGPGPPRSTPPICGSGLGRCA